MWKISHFEQSTDYWILCLKSQVQKYLTFKQQIEKQKLNANELLDGRKFLP